MTKISAEEKMGRITDVLKWSVGMAIFLALTKCVAGLVTQSMAVLASALDSLMDVCSSTGNLIASREAAKPPDEEHEYGHGKIESLAGLFQSLLIMLGGIYLVFEALRRFIQGSQVILFSLGLGVMCFSVAVTAFLVWRLKRVSRVCGSIILKAERLHYSMDILTHLGVVLILVLVKVTGWIFWDLLIALCMAVYILLSAYKILRFSIDVLLDRSPGFVSRQKIETIARKHHPNIAGIHRLRSRCVGEQVFLDFHIEIRNEKDFHKAHEIAESLVAEIKRLYPGADVTVHCDPEGAE